MKPEDGQLSIEDELRQERAAALGRVAARLEAALAALARFDAADAGRETVAEDAAEALYHLIVQREAMGVYHHEPVYEIYRVPGEVRRRLGVWRRRDR